MGFLKKLLLPLILFVVFGGLTFIVLDSLPKGDLVLLYPLVAELAVVFYFWDYQINKNKKSGIFYIYLTLIVVTLFIFTLVWSYLVATEAVAWSTFLVIYWIFVGVGLLLAGFLKLMYRGLNESLKNQSKGEHGLSKMKEIAKETMFTLDMYKKDATEAIKILKEVDEALEYSDPVSHKNVYAIERQIISELRVALRHAKNKHFGKIKAVMKDSNGVLFLIEKRNRVLKDSK